MVKRSISFLLLAGIFSCTGDPTGDLSKGVDHLSATPTQLFLTEGVQSSVLVTALDAAGLPVEATFSTPTVGAGITVARDVNFEPIRNAKGEFVPNPHPTRVQYLINTTASTASTSFVVRAGGEEITITARTVPEAGSVPTATVGNAAPPAGTATSLTIAAPYRFTAGSVISFSGSTLTAVNKTYSADSTTVTFFAPPSLTASTATVTNVVLDYAPTIGTFTTTSAATFTTAVPRVTVAPLTAVAGDTIRLTAPTGFRFTPGTTGNSAVTFPGTGNAIVSYSADSSQIKLLIGPSANGPASVTNVRYTGTAFAPFTFTSGTDSLKTPAVADVPAVFSSTTPNVNETFTVTAPAGFKFLASTRLRFGTDVQATVSVATDSNSMVVRAQKTGASGAVRFENVVLSFLTGVPFGAPTSTTLNVGATVVELTGTGTVATAPTIGLPLAVGQTAVLTDAPTSYAYAGLTTACGGPCPTRIYKVVAPAAVKVSLSANWNSNEDIGVYVLTSAGALASTTTFPPADNAGGGAGGHPETTTWTLPAGTSLIGVLTFGAAAVPTSLTLTFTGVP